MFLDLPQVEEFCSVTATKDREALSRDAAAACEWAEEQAGPIELVTVTERATSTGYYVRLANPPASIESIDASTDLPTINLLPGGFEAALTPGPHDVVYTAGSASIPGWAVSAAMLYTKHLWQSRLPGNASQQQPVNYAARAEAAISGHRRGPRP